MLKKISGQFGKFVVVGLISTAINYGTFFIFHTWLHTEYTLASAIGYCTGLAVGYILNRNWTFKSQRAEQGRRKEATLYIAVYTITLVACLGALRLQVEWLHINVLLANLLTIGLSTVMNFTGLKLAVFKTRTTL